MSSEIEIAKFCQQALAACGEMRGLFPETPLQRNEHLSAEYDADIYLKREDLSPVRSYKIRGAFNAMRNVLASNPDQASFVCASAGNHAQGVAFVCQHFKVRGVIFMPVTTPQQKIDKTRIFGGDSVDIHLVGDYFEDTLAAAQEYGRDNAAYFLAPFDDFDVILGQATVGVEMLAQIGKPIDMVVLPVGGGGLSAGITTYMSKMAPNTEFRYVEPEGGASLSAALAKGELTTLDTVNNFVDGAAVARIGDKNFEALKAVDPTHVHTAPENRICVTISNLLNIEGIVLEPAGAMSVDILTDLRDEIRGKTVVCVTSGGNFDFERLPDVKERAMRYSGLKRYFILRMPQRPGVLKEFLSLLGPDDDIARFEYLKKSARNFGSVLIGIESKGPDGFTSLCQRMDDAGFSYQDISDNEALSQFVI